MGAVRAFTLVRRFSTKSAARDGDEWSSLFFNQRARCLLVIQSLDEVSVCAQKKKNSLDWTDSYISSHKALNAGIVLVEN